ncbi:MAG: Gfo/Idh/MocA family oxidoreductase [Aquificaceae bacterium]
MHVLLVGLGNMGKKYLSKLEDMGEKLLLCDKDPSKDTGKHSFYCHFGDINEELKAAIIAIEPSMHVEVAQKFLKKGCHVLLEKPPALSSHEFEKIYDYPNLYVSEIETFSSCIKYFPKDFKEIRIERLGSGRGYISPLWDLAWHDFYMLQLFSEDISIESFKKDKVLELEGRADGIKFSLRVAWEHLNPSRKWFIDGGELVLDFAKEEVWREGKLIFQGKRDKLKMMLENFLRGEYDTKSKERAMKNIKLLEDIQGLLTSS